ncbi:hypothetical protein AQUCO_00500508v1 [Aquilegia coerulea]|uniref:Bet v I/Major latex protein domain-containing protein n=1 Tax=Aquilegia coerulea TaxID=218851 RepID=A0A2G5ES94_AQUCA|nr:hypothetical protein AQUCO_00500508v1 [Aquilegia coerulea]
MVGQVENELEVKVPAAVLWEIYKGLELGRLGSRLVPEFFERVEVVEGDGSVGTILKIVFPEGSLVPYHKEKFTVIDNEKRLKVAEIIEGGFLNLGFCLYRVLLQIIEKDPESSIIKSVIQFEVEPGSEADTSLITITAMQLVAEAIGKYLTEKI